MNKKRIIVVDDEPLISALLKELMEDDPDVEISRMVSRKEEFLTSVLSSDFDAALIDISVEGREGGLELLKILQNRGIPLPSVVLSAHEEIDYAPRCLQLGAKGYLNKKYICSDLKRALMEVMGGRFFVSGSEGKYILKKYKPASG